MTKILKVENCIFCQIVDKKIPSKKIYEDKNNLAFLDVYPISKGHTIVITKNHYQNIEAIPEDKLGELFKIVKKLATLIHERLNIDGYNILQSNFEAAGQVINHFHVHIIPRKKTDGKFKLKIPRIETPEEQLTEISNLLKI